MFAQKLQQIMRDCHLTQTELAKQIGVTRPSVGYWLKGSMPTEEHFEKLCKFLKTNPLEKTPFTVDDTTVTVPALDRNPTPEANVTDGNRGVLGIRFSKEWLNSRSQTNIENIRIINMTGSCMSPTIVEGDLLIIDTSVKHLTGDGIYILRQLGNNVVRRIQFELDQRTVNVMFDNPHYSTLTTKEAESLDVVGKVIFIYKRLTSI